jgi:cytidylate kinase
MPQVVTIDGPAGAGKSTVARCLAERLGWRLLDTGAMCRAVTFAAIRSAIDPADEPALAALTDRLRVELPPGRVVLDGEDITSLIRTPEVSQFASRVAVLPTVRSRLAAWQRAFAAQHDTVTEGRDQGTIVFPDAASKFFITATPEERARRRHAELIGCGRSIDFDSVLADQLQRDARDSSRDVAPLKPAVDALIVDTTGMDLDRVVAFVEALVRDPDGRVWRGGLEPDPRGKLPLVPRPFSGLWVAWNRSSNRILAAARSIEAIWHGAGLIEWTVPVFEKIPRRDCLFIGAVR